MARTLVSSPPFIGAPHPSISRHGCFYPLPVPVRRKFIGTRVQFSLHDIPPIDNSVDFNAAVARVEGLLYTLADAAVSASPATAAGSSSADAAVQKSGGWFGFVSDAMEVVLKVLKDLLATVHVPYAYGFAIILLTVLVKTATFPLTKRQVESNLAVQNLQPKVKAIQARYAGNQVLSDVGIDLAEVGDADFPISRENLRIRHHGLGWTLLNFKYHAQGTTPRTMSNMDIRTRQRSRYADFVLPRSC